jgi:hypothetical protein
VNRANEAMLAAYYAGEKVAKVAKLFGVSTGKMYSLLKNAGCKFRNRGIQDGWHPTAEMIEKSATARKGRKASEETRRRISEAMTQNYDGMNNYGHTKKLANGYVLAYAPLHPRSQRTGYVMLHTVIMERHIKRYLNADEVVHHRNHIRDDNRIENLELMKKTDHMRMHMKERNQRRNRYQ